MFQPFQQPSMARASQANTQKLPHSLILVTGLTSILKIAYILSEKNQNDSDLRGNVTSKSITHNWYGMIPLGFVASAEVHRIEHGVTSTCAERYQRYHLIPRWISDMSDMSVISDGFVMFFRDLFLDSLSSSWDLLQCGLGMKAKISGLKGLPGNHGFNRYGFQGRVHWSLPSHEDPLNHLRPKAKCSDPKSIQHGKISGL